MHSLPADVLLVIFKIVFHESLNHVRSMEPLLRSNGEIPDAMFFGGDNSAICWGNFDIHSSNFFPFALSSVCTCWRDIMSTIPIFWTRLVIFVGKDETPLSDVRQYLEWSRGLIIDVYVTRREDDFGEAEKRVHDPHEYEYARELVALMAPHFHRMKVVSFKLLQSSSLPRLLEDFYGSAPYLQTLDLRCEFDDGGPLDVDRKDRHPLVLPTLLMLSVDGRTLHRILSRFVAGVVLGIDEDNDVHLDVSHFTPHHDGERVDLHDFLAAVTRIQHIRELRLRDMALTWSDPRPSLNPYVYVPLEYSRITLEDLPAGAVQEFIHSTGFPDYESFEVIRCPVGALTVPLLADKLSLRRITDGDPADLAAFISTWEGRKLKLDRCPAAAVDAVLDALTVAHDSSEGDAPRLGARFLRELHLTSCGEFSFARLRRAFEVRQAWAEARGWTLELDRDWADTSPLTMAFVTGRRPALSRDDQEWHDKTDVVRWIPERS
ncbi:putative expressed protein [Lyophyllum shimeji]|uniref:Expressed protein n=1 Tax=Lyophyllum shimeji TaxID=47721 RepID=A0A9P3PWW9_LYOSH|nr:putative expressed protein [Lyophyllum shimeji]